MCCHGRVAASVGVVCHDGVERGSELEMAEWLDELGGAKIETLDSQYPQ